MSANKHSTITPAKRAQALEARRRRKMARSAHAYVRGSTVQFYRWLEGQGKRAVPKSPAIWICGDCHAGNLGPLASPDGNVHVQIRDLDQTVIGNPNHDLIRLGLSLASAARGSDLPGVTIAHMLEQMIIGYQRALKGPRAQDKIESDKPEKHQGGDAARHRKDVEASCAGAFERCESHHSMRRALLALDQRGEGGDRWIVRGGLCTQARDFS
jgi:hypothetical protein